MQSRSCHFRHRLPSDNYWNRFLITRVQLMYQGSPHALLLVQRDLSWADSRFAHKLRHDSLYRSIEINNSRRHDRGYRPSVLGHPLQHSEKSAPNPVHEKLFRRLHRRFHKNLPIERKRLYRGIVF